MPVHSSIFLLDLTATWLRISCYCYKNRNGSSIQLSGLFFSFSHFPFPIFLSYLPSSP